MRQKHELSLKPIIMFADPIKTFAPRLKNAASRI